MLSKPGPDDLDRCRDSNARLLDENEALQELVRLLHAKAPLLWPPERRSLRKLLQRVLADGTMTPRRKESDRMTETPDAEPGTYRAVVEFRARTDKEANVALNDAKAAIGGRVAYSILSASLDHLLEPKWERLAGPPMLDEP